MMQKGYYRHPSRNAGEWVGTVFGWVVLAAFAVFVLGLLVLGIQKVWGEIL